MNGILVCLVAMTTWGLLSASGCDNLQRFKVQLQWARAYSQGHDRNDLALAIGRAVVAQEPEILDELKKKGVENVDSPAFRSFASRKLANIDLLISLLDHPDALRAQIDHLKSHSHIFKHHEAFKNAFGHVVAAQLGRCFDKTAWSECFDAFIAHVEK